MTYQPSATRYHHMEYRRCGNSGLKLPAISLGLWHNFGYVDKYENGREIIHTAFDAGITHFDLANNYGPPPGSAEEQFGRILKNDLGSYRDELIISSKAGYYMWQGPYGEWGSKKYLVSSLDQSLKRMQLEYVDIFYHHRPDPSTPLEETMGALELIVKQGKALYVGISNYQAEDAAKAIEILAQAGVHCLIHQPKYSMFERWVEGDYWRYLTKRELAVFHFLRLPRITYRQVSERYPLRLTGSSKRNFLKRNPSYGKHLAKVKKLNVIAEERGQKLAHMALSWLLKDDRITSVLIGASKSSQVTDSIECLKNTYFSEEELKKIEDVLGS